MPETMPLFSVTIYWSDKERAPMAGEFMMAGPSGPFFAVTDFDGVSYMFHNDTIETIKLEIDELEVPDAGAEEAKPELIVVGDAGDEADEADASGSDDETEGS